MASVEETTEYKGFPLPYIDNQHRVDVGRLRSAFDMIDAYLENQTGRIPFIRSDGTIVGLVCAISDG